LIATHAKNCGIADPIYLCDTFTGVVKSSTEDSDYENSEHNDTSLQLVEDLLKFNFFDFSYAPRGGELTRD